MTNEKRFALRLGLESCGCAVVGYDRTGFQVQLKRGHFTDVLDFAKDNGLQLRFGSMNYFPLGSDNPPDEFRHWCDPYTLVNGHPKPGFWLYATFETVNGEVLCE